MTSSSKTQSDPSGQTSEREMVRRRRRRQLVVVALAPFVLGLLTAVPVFMVLFPHDDDPRSPDGVVVLGGVGQERADLGIELSKSYDVPLVLSSSATWFAKERGYRCSLGNALCLARPRFAESTGEEARYTAEFVAERGWDHVTVVTSSHHTPRARILFRQCLPDQVSVVGAPRPDGASVGEQIREVAGIVAALTIRRGC